ncbi:nuclear localization sequence binding protein [Coemansia sp. Benny D115]|nr:nuclear localization sequence binding protein [Coemansia sp. Benny D115]
MSSATASKSTSNKNAAASKVADESPEVMSAASSDNEEDGSDNESANESGSDAADSDADESSDNKRKADSDDDVSDNASDDAKKQKTDKPEVFSIFVANLPFECTEEQLRETFSKFGEVTGARLAYWQDSGKPRGFGYVDFTNKDAQDAAVAESEVVTIDSRALRVDVASSGGANNSAPRNNNRQDFGSQKPRNSEPSSTLFVGNLSFDSTEDSIRSAFSECGEVVSVRIVTDMETNRKKGFGYIQFADVDAATKAMELNNSDLDGRNIRLDYSQPRSASSGFGGGRGGFRGGRGGFRGGRGGFGGDRGGFGGDRGGRGGRGGFRGGRGGFRGGRGGY